MKMACITLPFGFNLFMMMGKYRHSFQIHGLTPDSEQGYNPPIPWILN